MYKIGIIDTMKDKGIELLMNYKDFDCEIVTDLSRENLLLKLPEFDGITLRRGKIDRKILNKCDKLKVIARHGVGYDSVDTECLKEKAITLLVAHDSTSTSPAEHIMFMIMNIYKGVSMFDTMVRGGDFIKAIHLNIEKNFELFNKIILITGFGRTGEAFGANKYNVQPDMITMAKAITNGAQPMGAVAVSDDIYNTIINSGPEHGVEFFHGYTYSAHPACVAASHATLDIYENEGIFEKAKHMSSYFLNAVMDELKDIPIVTDVRGDGLMAGIDLAVDGKPGVRGYDAQRKIFANGGHLKFTGDCGIIAPALISTEDQIDEMISVAKEVLVQY